VPCKRSRGFESPQTLTRYNRGELAVKPDGLGDSRVNIIGQAPCPCWDAVCLYVSLPAVYP